MPRKSGILKDLWLRRSWLRQKPGLSRSAGSVLLIKGKLLSCGIRKPGSRCITPLYGSAAAPRPMVDAIEPPYEGIHSRKPPALCRIPYFSATKIKWILDHVDGAMERELREGRLLVWNCGYVADLEADRRKGVCHRLYQRIPDDAV